RHFFDKHNDVKKIQEEVSRYMALSGRVVIKTYQTKDAQRWGYNDQGEPALMETAKVYGTLESRLPITCKCFSDVGFIILFDDIDTLILKARNPWIRSKIVAGEAGLSESDWERFARLGVRQARKGYFLTGGAYAHLTTEMNVYFRPDMFEHDCFDEVFKDQA